MVGSTEIRVEYEPLNRPNRGGDRVKKYSESYYEQKLTRAVKALGGLCWKFVSPGHSGVPDRIVILPGGAILFVELKAPGKKERLLQQVIQDRMRKLGVAVFSAVDSDEKIDGVIAECVKRARRKPGDQKGVIS